MVSRGGFDILAELSNFLNPYMHLDCADFILFPNSYGGSVVGLIRGFSIIACNLKYLLRDIQDLTCSAD